MRQELFWPIGLVAVMMGTVAAAVAHGVLRSALESRGVVPWHLRDTLGAIPLILLGSTGIGAVTGFVVVRLVENAPLTSEHLALTVSPQMMLGAGAFVLAVSALILTLGIIALRKLH